jgi:hypothetical protein
MHQLVLMTAIAAASGFFGGSRTNCANGQCRQYAPAPAANYQATPLTPFYQQSTPMLYPQPAYAYPTTYAQPALYQTSPAHQPAVITYQPTYYYYVPAVTCTTGACQAR